MCALPLAGLGVPDSSGSLCLPPRGLIRRAGGSLGRWCRVAWLSTKHTATIAQVMTDNARACCLCAPRCRGMLAPRLSTRVWPVHAYAIRSPRQRQCPRHAGRDWPSHDHWTQSRSGYGKGLVRLYAPRETNPVQASTVWCDTSILDTGNVGVSECESETSS